MAGTKTDWWNQAPYWTIRSKDKNSPNYAAPKPDDPFYENSNDKESPLIQFNQWIGEGIQDRIGEWALLDPYDATSDPNGSEDGPQVGFQLLGILPYDLNTSKQNVYSGAGETRRLSIHDILSIGLSQFQDWTVIPHLTVRPVNAMMKGNTGYDPDKPKSSMNNPTIWKSKEKAGADYVGPVGGGLWVGNSHVLTDLWVNLTETLDAGEPAYVEANIDELGLCALDFFIPKGEPGEPGEKGETGEFGPPGDPPEISIKDVSEGATVSVTKDASSTPYDVKLNFVIPKGRDGEDGKDSTQPGPKGDTGDKGMDGTISTFFFTDQGADGLAGDKGDRGPTGPQGIQGITGEEGLPGEEIPGPPGPTGITGPIGPVGPASTQTGPRGYVGDTGPSGPQGLTGPMGPANPQYGPRGDTGPMGIQGPKGDTGVTGDRGPQGFRGFTGPQSDLVGPKGDKGDTGDKGSKGDLGPASTEVGPAGATPEYYYSHNTNTLYILNV